MSEKAGITGLTPQNTLQEYFNFFDGASEEGNAAQVVPVLVHQDPEDTRYAIFIKGKNETVVHIMAALMQTLSDMYDAQQQEQASAGDVPSIIT